ncbi:hypothetical protein ABPG77_009780 [Micractinium sp. CCAP 211/92]
MNGSSCCRTHALAHLPAERLWQVICTFRQRGPAPALVGLARALTSSGLLGGEAQQALLSACLLSLTAAMLPVDEEYKRRVLRAAVLAAEEDGQEVCEELMEQYSACLVGPAAAGWDAPTGGDSGRGSWPAAAPPRPGWCYKQFAYAPAGEAAADTMLHLTALEQRAAQMLSSCEAPAEQQACCEKGQQQEQQERGGAHLAAHAAAAQGDGRRGQLALHVSLNLLEGGTGCHEWEAGFFLAEWVLSNPGLVAGRCCLEVGCGAGMVGVALHRAGARHVILTDGNPEAVANCRRNLALNGVPLLLEPVRGAGRQGNSSSSGHCSRPQCQDRPPGKEEQQQPGGQRWVECRTLCWEDGWPGGGEAQHPQQAQQAQHPTVVLGADLLYDPTVIPVLLGLLKQVLLGAVAAGPAAGAHSVGRQLASAQEQQQAAQEQHPPAVYLATTLRNEATLQQFLAAAEADTDISIHQLVPEHTAASGNNSWVSSHGDSTPATAAAPTPAGNALPACQPCASAPAATDGAEMQEVRFQHLPELDAARSRIFLHRLVLSATDS